MRTLLAALALAVVLAAGGVSAPAARAADECRGLLICLPVAGPWVLIPPLEAGQRTSTAVWELRCPLRGYIVAGIDARLSDTHIDVSFRGETGSPVSPGVTTGQSVLFAATFAGTGRKATSFRPFIGCVPARGGGARSQTSYAPREPTRTLAAVPPGRPVERRVVSARFSPGAPGSAVVSCARGDRLIGSSHSVGVDSENEPSAAILRGIRATHTISGATVLARATGAGSLPSGLVLELQVHAVCARAGR